MRSMLVVAAGLLLLSAAPVMTADLPKLPGIGGKSLLATVNKNLASQQIKDGQFEFKRGKAEFTPGNEQRINGLLKIIAANSKALKSVVPNLYVSAEGHTDADGSAAANQKLSLARAQTVCDALKAGGMELTCKPTGVGSSKPLAVPEKTAADKQRNRRVLVQMGR